MEKEAVKLLSVVNVPARRASDMVASAASNKGKPLQVKGQVA